MSNQTDGRRNGHPGQKERIGVYVCHCGSNIAGTVDVELSDTQIQARISEWKAPARDLPSGVLSKYARLVSSAALGAVTTAR